jgi:arylsulfatase A-like enzyme
MKTGWFTLSMACSVFWVLASCSKPDSAIPRIDGPNIVWVVWDTVRADHLSLYGYSKPTTPHLDMWARGARVFENCTSTAGSTIPSHASMFTGLLPTEHGANNQHRRFHDGHDSIAEILKGSGYRTYLYSANPNVAMELNFHQGFEVEEHPWDDQYEKEAFRILMSKLVPEDRSSELLDKVRSQTFTKWDIKASGELAQRGLLTWLKSSDKDRPFFAFINYMEAHRPYLPESQFRKIMMTPEQIAASYKVDRSWVPMWAYTFGVHEYSVDELALTAATYDATLAELDDIFSKLLAALEKSGHLEDTVIILTSDHGEQLGEHHMLDHQYSLYDPLLRVPLIVHYPKAFSPGRESRPVSNFDLFPTLLEVLNISSSATGSVSAISLLHPSPDRVRMAEYPAFFQRPLASIKEEYPSFDSASWERHLRAIFEGDHKFIWGSDGRHELYDLGKDPDELVNLLPAEATVGAKIEATLANRVERMRPRFEGGPPPQVSEEMMRRLGGLGYTDTSEPSETDAQPTSQKVKDGP